ncbi:hypothetical protein V3Q90_12420 [Flavobacterium oreochromis]|uniref:hypothetical protein n=1 Tax=Flavobacterium oreochromis TaxID=2906078 RepID=UPI000CDACE90|nr:hypothetical protein BWK58_06445 [Flavobacterium columnare]
MTDLKAIDRIMQYIHDQKIRPSHFEKKADLANGYLATQKRRNGSLGEEALFKILSAYPELNANWIITGFGDKINSNVNAVIGSEKSFEDKINYIYNYVIEKEAEKQIALLEAEIQSLKSTKKTL